MEKASASVNPYNGALNFTIPLSKVGGRGEAGYNISIGIKQNWSIFHTQSITHCINQPHCGGPQHFYRIDFNSEENSSNGAESLQPGFTPGVVKGRRSGAYEWSNYQAGVSEFPGLGHRLIPPIVNGTGTPYASGTKDSLTKIIFTSIDGSQVELADQATGGKPNSGSCLPPPNASSTGFSRGTTFSSINGSKITFVSDAEIKDMACSEASVWSGGGTGPFLVSGYLYFSNGTVYRIQSSKVEWIQDRNGNKTTITGGITDSLGRETVISSPDIYGNTKIITTKGIGGVDRSVTIHYDLLQNVLQSGNTLKTYSELFPNMSYSGQVSNYSESHNPKRISSIELPNGQLYRFSYNSFGELARVEYPTGAAVEYEYGKGSNDQGYVGTNGYWQNGLMSQSSWSGTGTDFQIYRRVYEERIYPNGGTGNSYESKTNWSLMNNDGSITIEKKDPSGNSLSFTKSYYFGNPAKSFFDSAKHPSGFADWREGKEYKTEVYSPNGNALLKKTEREWEAQTAGWWSTWCQQNNTVYCNNYPEYAVRNNPRVSRIISVIIEGGEALATLSKTEYDDNPNIDPFYFSSMNAKRAKSYHYKVLSLNTATTGNLQTIAGMFSESDLATVSETDYLYDANYKQRGILNLLQETRIKDSSGNIKAKSQIIYDEAGYLEAASVTNAPGWESTNTNYRGLPTSGRSWSDIANNQYVETHASYDQFGNSRKSWDGRGNFTETQYADNYTDNVNRNSYALLTKKILYSGANGTGTIFEASVKYDFNTGLPIFTTDINNQTSEIQYNDALLRPTKTIAPNGQQTIMEYGIPDSSGQLPTNQRFTKVKIQIDEQKWKEGYSWFDGLGRTIKTQSVDSSGDVFALTCYDSMGRVSKVSNPFKNVSNPTCSSNLEWTKTAYDTAGRLWKLITPDNSIVETIYSLATSGNSIGTVVNVKDQANKERRSITNVLGQLLRVDEPDVNNSNLLGAIDTPNQPTYYEYDTLNNLTKVKQGGTLANPTQTRSFSYDSLSRLKWANNPESGVINYTYDNNSNLLTKTDARIITTSYSYDGLNRVIFRNYSDSTPNVTYTYDNLPNAKGKLTKVENSLSKTEYQSFDSLGRVTQSQQFADGIAYPNITYKYNLLGALIEQKYPSGRVVRNVLDNEGDLSIVQSKKNNTAGFWNYADNFTYTAAGAVSSMQLGNGRWESTQFNNRLQTIQIALGTIQYGTDKLKLDFEYGTLNTGNGQVIAGTNNGNIGKQTITVPTEIRNSTTYNGFTATQYYLYDSLNRIKIANENTTPLNQSTYQSWGQAFDYDRYGNRTFNEANTTASANFPKACGGTMCAADKKIFNPQAQPSDNKFSTADGYQYDLAGNTTRDGQNRKFTYDAENKQTKVETVDISGNPTSTIGEYFYDGDGNRVKKITSTETVVFIYDAVGKLIAEYANQIAQPSDAKVSYLTVDHLGSTRINTDQNGNVTARHDYQPFGEKIQRAGYDTDNVRKKFTTYERDGEINLDYAQARYYNYNLGRFTTEDPLRSSGKLKNPQTLNRYIYVINNPYKFIDPSGLTPCDPDDPTCKEYETEQAAAPAFAPAPAPPPVVEPQPDIGTGETAANYPDPDDIRVAQQLFRIVVAAPAVVATVLVLADSLGSRTERFTTAVINFYEAGVWGPLPHVSITLYPSDPTAPSKSTELVGNEDTIIKRDDYTDKADAHSKSITLPDGNSALTYQRSVYGTRQGPYDLNTNSCVTHVLKVLAAGGIPVPSEAFTNVEAGEAFLGTFRSP